MSITIYKHSGSLTVITGPMFSGKTTELTRQYTEHSEQKHSTLVLKPRIDTRYDNLSIVTHDKIKTPALAIESLKEAEEKVKNADYIFIDEVQFFTPKDFKEIEVWIALNKHIIVAGLDTDYLAKPFGIMPHLIKIANKTFFLNGNCDICNNPSTHTFRKDSQRDELILIGESATYLGLCERCYLHETKKHENI